MFIKLWTPNAPTPCILDLQLHKIISYPTDVSDKSWLPCHCWFFFKRFLKFFFPSKPSLNFGSQTLESHGPLDLHLHTFETLYPTDVSDKSWLPWYFWFIRSFFFPLKPMLNFGPQLLGLRGHQDLYLYILETSCATDVSDISWLPCYCWFLRRRFLKLFPIEAQIKIFASKCLDPKDVWNTICTYLNLHLPRIIHAKFGPDWPSGFRGED